MKSILIKSGLAILIFVISLAATYYPLHKKGYAIDGEFIGLSQARNFALANTYQYESQNGVFLSSDKAATEGKKLGILNPLTPIIYGYIFKFFGTSNLLMPMYLAVILFALFDTVIFLLIARLFNLIVGFSSALIMAFMPAMVTGALSFGYFEFAMIFFAAALWLFFDSDKPFQASLWRLGVASIFFALAALARNAFLLSFVPFVLFDFYKNRAWKRSLVFILPFAIIFGSTLTSYSWLGVPNGYLSGINNQPFSQIGHIYNDPYSYYYNGDNYLKNLLATGEINRVDVHFLSQWGYNIGLSDQIGAYKNSIIFYLTQIVDLTNYGGPLILVIMLLGGYWLYKNKREMLWFFGLWFVIWFGGLVYFRSGNWDHLLEIIFMAAALSGLGLYQLLELLKPLPLKQSIMGGVLLLFVLGHLTYADKWKLFDAYRSSYFGTTIEMVKNIQDTKTAGVIAAGVHPTLASGIYYLTNRNVIYFNPVTVDELINNGQLKKAFDIYNVKMAVGFSGSASQVIKTSTGAQVIPLDLVNKD